MTRKPDADAVLDVLVGGGGYVGLSLGVALKQADPALSVAVVDMRPREAMAGDPRASAIAAAASRMLDQLGVWADIAPHAQPMTEMIVTDSKLRDAVRPVFLTFDGEVEPGEPFAHMVPNGKMVAALANRAEALGVELIAPESVSDFAVGEADVAITLGSGKTRRARLLVAADGVRSRLRDLAGIQTVKWEYDQSGIVTTIRHERPHNGRAEEHFLPSGPFAILPLTGNRSSIVWTEAEADAADLMALPEDDFISELTQRAGDFMGALEVVGPRWSYPLSLQYTKTSTAPRLALAGDSAHGIHPIAGQGLNMGLRDVAALAEVLVDARRLGLDIGSTGVLQKYDRWRRFDNTTMLASTDGLNRLFSNDIAPLRIARDLGLAAVNRAGPLKKFLMRQAMGLTGTLPKLLKGEPL
mgnify:CR=1 FL=1